MDGGPSSFLHEGILWLRCIGVPGRTAWRRSWRARAAARWDPGGTAEAGGGGSGVSRPRSVLLRVVGLGRRPAVLSGGGRSRRLSSFADLIGDGRRRWLDAGSEHGGGVVPFRDDNRVWVLVAASVAADLGIPLPGTSQDAAARAREMKFLRTDLSENLLLTTAKAGGGGAVCVVPFLKASPWRSSRSLSATSGETLDQLIG